jgi:Glycosyltransferase family 29 (sialyltransferase)
MNLIDPYQFRDLCGGARSVAIVGNAPCILDWKDGARIEAADLVVRFNRARTAGMEEAIGSRTDVLFVNSANSLEKAPPPDKLSRPKCLVCFVSPQGVKTKDIAPFREWAGDVPVLLSFGPDLLGLPGATRQRPLTSGTYALYTLSRVLDIERLFVTGFTMFGAVPGGGGKYWDEPMPHAAVVHDLDHEARLFVALLAGFTGQLETTDEIVQLAAQNGVRLGVAAARGRGRPRALHKRIAEGLAWRVLRSGMALRRVADSK